MKKKILAVVLAAATAFSMFGASLSASAAFTAIDPANIDVKTAAQVVTTAIGGKDFTDDTVATKASPDEFFDVVAAIQAAIVEDTDAAVSANGIYAYDYTGTYAGTVAWNAFLSAVEAAAAQPVSDTQAFIAVYTNAIAAISAAAGNLVPDVTTNYTVTGTRKELLTAYAAAKSTYTSMNTNSTDYVTASPLYDSSIANILADLNTLTVADAATLSNSELTWRLALVEGILALVDLEDVGTAFELLEAEIENAELILANREYYKDSSLADSAFTNLESKLDKAYEVLNDYAVANSAINTAKDNLIAAISRVNNYAVKYTTRSAQYLALNALLDKVTAIEGDTNGYPTAGVDEALGLAKTAGTAAKTSLRALDIDEAIVALEDAIAGLYVVPAKGSTVLKAEEDTAFVATLVEEDYTAKSWAAFELLLAAYEEAVTDLEVYNTSTAVKNGRNDLVKLNTREAKAEFKAALAAAEKVWIAGEKAKHAGKTLAAVNAFLAAIEVYGNYDGINANDAYDFDPNAATSTNSKLEAATAAINAAVEAYKDNKAVEAYEGWAFEKDNGWFYYVDGEKATGWIFDEDYNAWFYLNEDGTMKTGWHWDAEYNAWFFLSGNGAMASNCWINDNGTWYYLYESGRMAANTTIGEYKVDASGAWVA